MENSAFAFARKFGKSRILLILVIMLPMFGLQIMMYQLPKVIIDDAIGGGEGTRQVFGIELERLDYLWVLCAAFLFLVLIIGLIKFIVQTMKGVMAERLLRRLRYQLLERTMRFPLSHFQKTSQNEIVTTVTAETEPLGGFFGEAYVQPLFQGGIFLVVLIFLFSQNIALGVVASMSMPIQAWIVPKLQKRIRLLGKERVKNVRRLSEQVGETVSGISDLHVNDGIRYAQADFSSRLGKIFSIRFEIYRRKFFMKFLNNFINQLTPFFFYSIGGYLVITGDLTIGALTAGLVAYKDLAAPWKELLIWYQLQADSTIKYDTLIELFQPQGMIDSERQTGLPQLPDWRQQDLKLSNLTFAESDDWIQVDHVNFTFRPGRPVLLTGAPTSGKHELARLLSGLVMPTSGQVRIADQDFSEVHRSILGSRVGYIGPESSVFTGSIYKNLVLGLRRYPEDKTDESIEDFKKEAMASGNSDLPRDADWLQLADAGLQNRSDLKRRIFSTIDLLGLEDDFYEAGMMSVIDPSDYGELVDGVLQAREALSQRLQAEGNQDLVTRFEIDQFNRYASVAENVVYGQPTDSTFAFARLGENDYVHRLLEEQGLKDDFLTIGLKLAHLLVDLFKDQASGDYFFEQYSFVTDDSLENLGSIVRRVDSMGESALSQDDRNELRSLPFNLVPQRHRLNLLDEAMEQRLIRLRHAFRENLPAELQDKVIFLEQDAYNPGLSIQANILFGRIAHGRAQAVAHVWRIINDIMNSLDLRQTILMIALRQDVGKGGSRLLLAQRQLMALARTLIKEPHLLIVDEALSALPLAERSRIAAELIQRFQDRVFIWIEQSADLDAPFAQQLVMENGRLRDIDSSVEAPAIPEPAEKEAESNLGSEVELLRQIPMFARLERQALLLLAFSSEIIQFKAGEEVFHQGDIGESAYVILSGTGEVWLENGDETRIINTVHENGIVGEMALLGNADNHRSASLVAKTDMECLMITREVFVELVQQNPSVTAQVNQILVKRLQDTTKQLLNLKT